MYRNTLLTIALTLSVYSLAGAQDDCACCGEVYRQFDFWLGEWSVSEGDSLAGVSSITLLQDKCVLMENWQSKRSAYTGTSFNFFDRDLGKWRQVWIDNQGGSLDLRGSYKDGKMVLESSPKENAAGHMEWDRITWTSLDDGNVSQVWTKTQDGGSTLVTLFNGLYKPKS